MAEREDQSNNPSPSRKANPSDSGQDKAQIKKGKTAEELEREEGIRQEHTDEGKIPSHLENMPTEIPTNRILISPLMEEREKKGLEKIPGLLVISQLLTMPGP